MVGGVEELAALALGECPLDLEARADEDGLQFLGGITEAEGAEGMDPLGEGLQMRGDAGDGAVGKAPAAVCIELFVEGVEERPRQAARPERALVTPLLRCMKARKRPRSRRCTARELWAVVTSTAKYASSQRGEGVGAVREIEAHRQAGFPAPAARGAGFPGVSCFILSFSDLAHFWDCWRHGFRDSCDKTLNERYLL